MKRQKLLTSLLLLFTLIVGSTNVWATDILKETLDLTDKSAKASGYTATSEWNSTWTLYGGNNNNQGWEFVRFGGKASTSGTATTGTAMIYTTSKIGNAIDYVVIEHLGVNGKKPADFSVTSIVLETSSASNFSNATTTTLTSYDVASSETTKTITITPTNQVAKDSYFRIKINWSSTNTNNMGLDVEKVKLYQNAPAYTITAQSNNNTYGSVSLSGSVITGAPEDGYRYASPAYTVIVGTATVSQNGNDFTVTPTSDCTVRINFEAIPTHTITCVADPVGAGTFDAVSSLYEGGTTEITAAASSGYKFTGWSVSGTGASLSSTTDNPTTITMGTADATVTANFEAVTTYAITWNVNGEDVRIDNVEENTAITFPKTITGIPVGYELRGWVAEANKIIGTTDEDPKANYVTSATSTVNTTYYAVMGVFIEREADTYEKLTSNSFDTNATYVIAATQAAQNSTLWYFNSYDNKVDENASWGKMTTSPATNAPITFTLSGTSSALVAKDNSGNYLKGLTTGNFQMSSTSTTLTLSNTGEIGNSNNTYLLRHNYNSGNGGLRWYSSTTGTQAYFYKVIENYVYSNYCTTVPTATVSINAACNDGEETPTYYGTYSNDKAFVVPADMTVSAIKVANGKLVVTAYDEGDIVKAGTGVMVSSATSGNHTITLAAGGDEIEGNMLYGSGDAGIDADDMAAIVDDCKYYRLTMHGYEAGVNPGELGFYWGAASGAAFALGANKAFLAVPNALAKEGFSISFDDDDTNNPSDETTAIAGVGTLTNAGNVYNLAGQKVDASYKGIVLINGKKYINK